VATATTTSCARRRGGSSADVIRSRLPPACAREQPRHHQGPGLLGALHEISEPTSAALPPRSARSTTVGAELASRAGCHRPRGVPRARAWRSGGVPQRRSAARRPRRLRHRRRRRPSRTSSKTFRAARPLRAGRRRPKQAAATTCFSLLGGVTRLRSADRWRSGARRQAPLHARTTAADYESRSRPASLDGQRIGSPARAARASTAARGDLFLRIRLRTTPGFQIDAST